MRSNKFINYSTLFVFLSITFLAACGSKEKHIYVGNLLEAKFASGSNYASSQINHKDVEITIETLGKNDRNLYVKSSDGLKFGDCELPIKFYMYDGNKKGDISTCDRKTGAGTEVRNIGGGTSKVDLDGQKLKITLNIDNVFYTFEGTEKQ
ncbi:MAG TPA: hypothetical protein PKY59_13955 [Pyrinomonadaceae bacterium]|nr:hypothetical protein [Pyrinomonadaceae bacterium]